MAKLPLTMKQALKESSPRSISFLQSKKFGITKILKTIDEIAAPNVADAETIYMTAARRATRQLNYALSEDALSPVPLR